MVKERNLDERGVFFEVKRVCIQTFYDVVNHSDLHACCTVARCNLKLAIEQPHSCANVIGCKIISRRCYCACAVCEIERARSHILQKAVVSRRKPFFGKDVGGELKAVICKLIKRRLLPSCLHACAIGKIGQRKACGIRAGEDFCFKSLVANDHCIALKGDGQKVFCGVCPRLRCECGAGGKAVCAAVVFFYNQLGIGKQQQVLIV